MSDNYEDEDEFRIDIEPGPFNVKGHTAHFTGAFWFIVTEGDSTLPIKVDGIEFYDDWNDAQHIANDLNRRVSITVKD